jgi:hypothetical protein
MRREQWQAPAVVDVCVREHHGIELIDGNRESNVLRLRLRAVPLKQTAIEDNCPSADVD